MVVAELGLSPKRRHQLLTPPVVCLGILGTTGGPSDDERKGIVGVGRHGSRRKTRHGEATHMRQVQQSGRA